MKRINTEKFNETFMSKVGINVIKRSSLHRPFSYANNNIDLTLKSFLIDTVVGERDVKYVITIPTLTLIDEHNFKQYKMLMRDYNSDHQIGLTAIINDLDKKFAIIENDEEAPPLLLQSDKHKKIVNIMVDRDFANNNINDRIKMFKAISTSFNNSVSIFTKAYNIAQYGYLSNVRCNGFNILNAFLFNKDDKKYAHVTVNVSNAITIDGHTYSDKYVRGYNFVL